MNKDLFTRDSALAADDTVLAAMIGTVKRKISSIARGDKELRIAAAYTTHTAFRVRSDFNVGKFAAELGTSRSNVYMWKRLGVAVVDLGVEPGDERWTMLNAAINMNPISWVMDGLGHDGLGEESSRTKKNDGTVKAGEANILPTLEDLDWALNIVFPTKEDGTRDKRQSAKEVAAALAKEGIGQAEPEVVETPEEMARTMSKRLDASLQYVIDNLGDVTPESFSSLAPKIAQILEIAKRQQAAATPAAKKTAAKKTASAA